MQGDSVALMPIILELSAPQLKTWLSQGDFCQL